ncbi:hypothetical protein EPO17_01705 [Patescibacteria group bacterium]|nr:MAG: hypothetical protein EPO17_01705 [Patescibacteria group bacterium]
MDTTLTPLAGNTGPSAPTPNPQTTGSIKHIRTFESDANEALQSQNASLIKIAVAENDRRQETPVVSEVERGGIGKKIAITLVSIAFIAGGVGAIYYIYTHSQKAPTPTTSQTLSSIIPYQKAKEINSTGLTKEALVEKLNQEIKTSTVAIGSIEYFYITTTGNTGKQMLSTEGLFSTLGLTAPNEFVRSLDPQYMFGVLGQTVNSPFLILKSTLYQSGFAGMLNWEKTIADDLQGLLTDDAGAENTAPSRTSDDLLQTELKFSDIIIQNRDVRVLKDRYGITRIAYSFVDNNTIVIAPNEKTLSGIIEAVTKRKFTR